MRERHVLLLETSQVRHAQGDRLPRRLGLDYWQGGELPLEGECAAGRVVVPPRTATSVEEQVVEFPLAQDGVVNFGGGALGVGWHDGVGVGQQVEEQQGALLVE